MFLRKRRLSKENKSYNRRIFVAVIFFVVVVSALSAFIYHVFPFGGNMILNPMSKNVDTFEINLKKGLEDSNIKYTRIDANIDGSEKIKLVSGAEVIFNKKKTIKSQIDSLQLLLSRLTIEGKQLKILDFRFVNPVVSFK